MTKEKKKNSLENPGLAVIANDVKHIKECTDKLVKKIGYIERGMDQIGLNQQNINTLKNNVKGVKGDLKTEVENIENTLKGKVGTTAFYVMIGILGVLNGFAIYFQTIFRR